MVRADNGIVRAHALPPGLRIRSCFAALMLEKFVGVNERGIDPARELRSSKVFLPSHMAGEIRDPGRLERRGRRPELPHVALEELVSAEPCDGLGNVRVGGFG